MNPVHRNAIERADLTHGMRNGDAGWRHRQPPPRHAVPGHRPLLLEQIISALGRLSDRFAQIYELIVGQASPPELLEELLASWTDNHVMQAQRDDHHLGLPQGALQAASTTTLAAQVDLQIAAGQGPRIELF